MLLQEYLQLVSRKHLHTGSLAAQAKLYIIAFLVCVNLSNPLGPAYDVSHDSGLGHFLAPDFFSVQVHGHVLPNEETKELLWNWHLPVVT